MQIEKPLSNRIVTDNREAAELGKNRQNRGG